jgi:amino acid adenylation domain-containing protein
MDENSISVASLPPQVAARLHEALRAANNGGTRGPGRQRRSGPLPLSFAQERLWFLDRWAPGSALYNISAAVRLSGPLSVNVLRTCVDEVVRRHESLRTTFGIVDGKPVQRVAERLTIPVALVDVTPFPESMREVEAQRVIARDAGQSFDLTQGPLMRVMLLRIGPLDQVLALTLHHIVSDGWSMTVLFRELSALYEAYSCGRSSPLQELPIQYADFAVWQRQSLEGEALLGQLAWWRNRLVGAPPLLSLPSDRPRPAIPSYRGGLHTFQFPTALSRELKRLSQSEGATLFMIVLAAFQVLLGRYTGERDIVVGTPIANRTCPEVEGLIGFFVNTLVLRTDLGGSPSFRELLKRVRQTTLDAYGHQDLPFEKLVQALEPERALNHNPIFQVMLVLQNAPGSAGSSPGPAPQAGPGISRFDLALSLVETTGGLCGALEYSSDLFEADRMRRLAIHFETLLEAVVADPDRCILDLSLLPEAEQRQVLVEWNRTQSPYPEGCAHDFFEEQALAAPQSVAVIADGQEWSYGELNARANQLAHYLRGQGVGPEALVGIHMERSAETIAAVLGVLKAGGAYLPLDPDYPAERLEFMRRDSACRLVLTRDMLWRRRRHIEKQSTDNPAPLALSANLAYAMYTSGSTGKPKAVAVCQAGLVNLILSQRRIWASSRRERVLQFASLSFDASLFEILLALSNGHALCIGSRRELTPGSDLAQFMRDYQVSTTVLPPSLLTYLAEDLLPELETLIVAGENCPADVALKWGRGRRFVNAYGPTEATIWATMFDYVEASGPPPIGRPIENIRCYVLDDRMAPVPIGIAGELYLGGVGLARGYLQHPELTADRFVPDPFHSEPGSRLYRTGDLVRYRPDGNLEFLGRRDHQVKLRGLRIEMEEIEAALRCVTGVRNAAVAMEETESGPRLVAYVAGEQVADTELSQELSRILPTYMIPAAFVWLERLPAGPSGKLDRQALPKLVERVRQEAYVAPRNATEESLAKIWSEMLGVPRVGVHDNFFALGGHSLLATRVVSAILNAFDVEVPLRTIFESPSISGLAAAIERVQENAGAATASRITRISREGRRGKLSEWKGEHAN